MNGNKPVSTGHTSIDNHHEELFHLVSLLDRAIRRGDENAIDDIISFLEHYVQDHFKEEEDLMLENDYAGYKKHKTEHERFKVHVKDLRENFNNNTPLTHIIFDIRRFLDSLVIHIQTIDIGIAKLTGEKQ